MKRLAWLLTATAAISACGGGAVTTATGGNGGSTTGTGGSGAASSSSSSGMSSSTSTSSSATSTSTSSSSTGGIPCGGGCPSGYTCGTANGIDVCRAATGIPLFSHVFVVVMENTSLATMQKAYAAGTAPNLQAMTQKYATGSDYHGVAHPSLPNYIALTSGDTQGIGCDCHADPTAGSCNGLTCNLVLGSCGCNKPAMNLADQLETAGKSWMAYGEDMGAPCNLTDSGDYAVRHVPFLYYDDVQSNTTRCHTHVVDFANFDPASAAAFTFVAPNLVHDMHDPSLPSDQTAITENIPNGDMWLGPQVDKILASQAYQQGGLLVVVWDEDDDSGGILGSDDPIGIFVISPYAKSGGYVSAAHADHYNLLATIEDGLGLPRLGHAASVPPLSDYFPAN